jgi:hypothetical protein
MNFGYQPIAIHNALSDDARQLVCDQLDPQLADVHAMMRLPIDTDAGLSAGCNLAATQVLLSVVSGVSVTLFKKGMLIERGVRGRLFKEAIEQHYPWDQEIEAPERSFGAEAAREMYDLFRNPLAHALGVVDSETNSKGRLLTIEKAPMQEAELYDLEMSGSRVERWLPPTLLAKGSVLTLSVRSLYWGVRQMIERIVQTPDASAFTFLTASTKFSPP